MRAGKKVKWLCYGEVKEGVITKVGDWIISIRTDKGLTWCFRSSVIEDKNN